MRNETLTNPTLIVKLNVICTDAGFFCEVLNLSLLMVRES